MTAARPYRPASVLSRLQHGIERLYRVETGLDVEAFMIGEAARQQAGVARSPREQLLVTQPSADEVWLGLFLDRDAIANLERHDPADDLDDGNFNDFCLAVEGISHFVYVALCAEIERAVTALELELQAEVDKFACCLLLELAHARHRRRRGNEYALRRRLYDDVRWADDLDATERDRYHRANDGARRYSGALERRFLTTGRILDLLAELRLFYRLDLDGKLGRIARLSSS